MSEERFDNTNRSDNDAKTMTSAFAIGFLGLLLLFIPPLGAALLIIAVAIVTIRYRCVVETLFFLAGIGSMITVIYGIAVLNGNTNKWLSVPLFGIGLGALLADGAASTRFSAVRWLTMLLLLSAAIGGLTVFGYGIQLLSTEVTDWPGVALLGIGMGALIGAGMGIGTSQRKAHGE
jgi:hypothetical protein